ncbi:hypothetical protein ABI59_21305 [Acidobacteria bacterium Mor1]|nr:hypothetical protein ABI59_21305 [Acidobacteria bacterium Mor1]
MRLLAQSDLHLNRRENRQWLESLSRHDYQRDVLIVAGDVSHRLDQMRWAFEELLARFKEVAFVPGNHDLWVHRENFPDSTAKLAAVEALCLELGIHVSPVRPGGGAGPWLVPLFSWYRRPPHPDSLFLPKPGEDPNFRGWSDDRFVRWAGETTEPPDSLTRRAPFTPDDGAPVISFSHFLPRAELIFSAGPYRGTDPRPGFNFSRYAGSLEIERAVRRLGSAVHVYGHQHRNRRRRIDGVLYLSHCLGYGPERDAGRVGNGAAEPLALWEDGPVTLEGVEEGTPERVSRFIESLNRAED